MGIVSQGIRLHRAVKSAARLRQILLVFAKHGFADVISRSGLNTYLPKAFKPSAESQARTLSERFRMALEELGPTFVKFGQVLSMRPDLVPEHFIHELIKLQDQVHTVPVDQIKAIITQELGQPIDHVFSVFDDSPLAAASIAQVHTAVLKSGESVVVKVQRPGIEKTIETDISLMTLIAENLEKVFPELKVLNPRVFVEEFFKTLAQEIDFTIEVNNLSKIAANLAQFPEFKIPKPYREFTTSRILVMERLYGKTLNDPTAFDGVPVERRTLALAGARAFFYSILKFGLFHGDLHSGNVLILQSGQMGVVDFGMVGRLSQRSRDQLAVMVWSLVHEDYETLCYTYAELGAVETSIDFDAFQREVRNTLAPYLGMNLNEVNVGKVLIEATQIAARYHIRIPGDWMLVFRAIVTSEGMGRVLDPTFDMMSLGTELIEDIVKVQFSPDRFQTEGMRLAKDFLLLAQGLPRHLRWGLRKWAKNDYALEWVSPDVRRLTEIHEKGAKKLSKAFQSAAFLVAGAIIMLSGRGPVWGDLPLLGVLLVVIGLIKAL